MVTDVAVMIGYIAVFTVRAPDFTAGMAEIKDLNIAGVLLCVPLIATVLAGVSPAAGYRLGGPGRRSGRAAWPGAWQFAHHTGRDRTDVYDVLLGRSGFAHSHRLGRISGHAVHGRHWAGAGDGAL